MNVRRALRTRNSMSDKIARLEGYKPHLAGPAVCLQCKKEWTVVAPVGISEGFECPECGTFKGVLQGLVNLEDRAHWRCNCGNFLFSIAEDKCIYCIKCGTVQKF